MATRPKAVIESRNGEEFSPITIAKNVLTDDGQNLYDILSDRKEDMMSPTIENSSSMFKVGQGDNVDYNENVVDGAYESLVFKGKSLVNLLTSLRPDTHSAWVRNGSSFTLNTSGVLFLNYTALLKPNTTYTVVGELDFDVDGIVIGFREDNKSWEVSRSVGSRGRFSVLISTSAKSTSNALTVHREVTANSDRVTLSNLMVLEGDWTNKELPPYFEGICDCKSPILSNVGKNLFDGEIEAGRWLTSGNLEKYNITTGFRSANIITITPSSRYTISGNFKAIGYFVFGNKDGYITRYIGLPRSSQSMSFNTNLDEYYGVWYTVDIEQTEANKPTDIQLEETSAATPYEPYKSNILSCNGDKIELTEDMFEQGAIAQYINSQSIGKTYQWMKDNSNPNYDKRRLRLKNLVKVKPNTKLILQNTDNFMYAMCGFDSNKLNLGTFDTSWIQNTTITIPQDVHYISFFIRKKDDTSIAIDDFKNTNFTLSEVDKTIVLRSLPGDVCDTLNVETGEYVQRIGEIVLDGSYIAHSNQSGYSSITSTAVLLNLKSSEPPQNRITKFICKDLPHYLAGDAIWAKGTPVDTGISGVSGAWDFCIRLPYTVTGGTSADSNDVIRQKFKEYLNTNPVTVQYELATPVVKTVDIQGFPYAYTKGHVQLSSGSIKQSLTPKVEYSVVTNRNGQIRSNQKMVERHQKQLDRLQAMVLTNLVNTQYEQTLTNLKYDLKNVREEVK